MDPEASLSTLNLHDDATELQLNQRHSDAEKLPLPISLSERLQQDGYSVTISKRQRRYYLTCVEGDNSVLKHCQVFCGRIPTHMTEKQLFPLFETCGKVMDFQLMMSVCTDQSRGFVFVTFAESAEAADCVEKLNNYKIDNGAYLNVRISVPNQRLFIGSIPKIKSKDAIRAEFDNHITGIIEVIVYNCPDDELCMNRGFCFIDFESHQAAAKAKRRMESGRVRIWSNEICVDWADPQEEPDENIMTSVKVLHITQLSTDLSEGDLKQTFEEFGKTKHIMKMKKYGFNHFEQRNCAIAAMNALKGKTFNDSNPIDINKKMKCSAAEKHVSPQPLQ